MTFHPAVKFSPALLLLFACLTLPGPARADAQLLEEIRVVDEKVDGAEALEQAAINPQASRVSDTAELLRNIPGAAAYSAGGVSALPVIHGLADDRLRTRVDGMDLVASCPNHMNSPLSYIAPSMVENLTVYTGTAPVSLGGDSIGATIIADTTAPRFAGPGQSLLTSGELGGYYRSNGDATGVYGGAAAASENFSISYDGSYAKSDNYQAGGDFKDYTWTGRAGHELPRDEVGSTAYEVQNHALGLALKQGTNLFEAKLGYQDIPEELYPNQRMDLLDNEQKRAGLRYLGQFGWGSLEARGYYEKVEHFMDFGADKKLIYGTLPGTDGNTYIVSGMPMYTEGETTGISLKSEIPLSADDLLRIGTDVQWYRLDDWWPPSPDCGVGICTGGMAPNTFWNINDGQRDRYGIYAEWESQRSREWMTRAGLRTEVVKTDAGDVTGYNTGDKYKGSSVGTIDDFNAMDLAQTDINIDWALAARYTPAETLTFEFGLARKTRSPNLYERYAWSTNSMALEMNNFVGDGNGYLGDPDLEAETAHTVSLSTDWHTPDRTMELKVAPYYTRVSNFIDATQWDTTANQPADPLLAAQFVRLKYANQTAAIYGVDISGRMPLGRSALGDFGLNGFLSYTRGENRDTDDGLYNIMPLNVKAVLTHTFAGFDNALEFIGVDEKDDVSSARNEIKTPGYSLVNLRTSYSWADYRIDLGVENLFDKKYYLPLGGAYTGQGSTMSFNRESLAGTSLWGTAVPGMGRSIYVGFNVKF